MFNDLFSYGAAALGALSLIALVVIVGLPNRQRDAEDAARAFFDEHGRWPDEDR